jgi:hypothetical protein
MGFQSCTREDDGPCAVNSSGSAAVTDSSMSNKGLNFEPNLETALPPIHSYIDPRVVYSAARATQNQPSHTRTSSKPDLPAQEHRSSLSSKSSRLFQFNRKWRKSKVQKHSRNMSTTCVGLVSSTSLEAKIYTSGTGTEHKTLHGRSISLPNLLEATRGEEGSGHYEAEPTKPDFQTSLAPVMETLLEDMITLVETRTPEHDGPLGARGASPWSMENPSSQPENNVNPLDQIEKKLEVRPHV